MGKRFDWKIFGWVLRFPPDGLGIPHRAVSVLPGFNAATAQGAIITIAFGLVMGVVGMSLDSVLNNIFRAVHYAYSTDQPLPEAIQDRHGSLEEGFRSRRLR